jgi:WhiB family redox-sensing transcriptional regulator
MTTNEGTDVLISCATGWDVAASPTGLSGEPLSRASRADLPCRIQDADLWFSEIPAQLEMAKTFCADCPARIACLTGAIRRREPWGVWRGGIFEQGRIIARKRPRGRPRKDDIAA